MPEEQMVIALGEVDGLLFVAEDLEELEERLLGNDDAGVLPFEAPSRFTAM